MVLSQQELASPPSPGSYGDPQRTGLTAQDLRDGVTEHLFFTLGCSIETATPHDLTMALSHAVRDRLMVRALASQEAVERNRAKSVDYLSAEFLIGPQLGNNLLMLGLREEAERAMRSFGIHSLESLLHLEEEPGLGNGGLGRLAACFIESMASLAIQAIGCGIRYEFGMFDQTIQDGWQVEISDPWLKGGWPWEVVRPNLQCRVGFGGHWESWRDGQGKERSRWLPTEIFLSLATEFRLVPAYACGDQWQSIISIFKHLTAASFMPPNTKRYIPSLSPRFSLQTMTPKQAADCG